MAKSVRDAMTSNPLTIGARDPVVDAARLMRDKDIGALPVVEDGRLLGMITDRDIAVRVVAEGSDPGSLTVRDIASRDAVKATPDQDLDEALRLMAKHQVRRLPVTEGDQLVGVLAQADVAQEHDPKKVGQMVESISESSSADRRV